MTIDVEPMLFGEIADHRPLLVLLHAFPLDRRMWSPQISGLAHLVPVMSLDLPGFGRSRDFEVAPDMSRWTDAVANAIQERCGERPVVVAGLSMGGYVALHLIRTQRDLISGLILCDTRAEADTPEARAARDETVRMVGQRGVGVLADTMIPKLLAPSADDEVRDVVRGLILEQDPSAIQAALRTMRDRPDSRDLLPSLDIPVQVIVGSDDSLTPPADSEAMAAAAPGSELVVIPGAAHLSNLEKPRDFNNAVAAFLGDAFL
jgi:pimeloyl-ACP methyl ester carboxylesterase